MNKISKIAINVLSCFFLLTGCDSKSVTDETTKNITFTVKLKYIDAESTPLAGSKIDIVDDDDQLITSGTLDKYGMFSFDAPEDKNYHVKAKKFPRGYYLQEDVILNKDTPYIYSKVSSTIDSQSAPTGYTYSTPGEIAFDSNLTDYADKKNVYTLSSLLENKSFVVLNFFYIGCQPCEQEFPALTEAYLEYQDVMNLVAVDTAYKQTAAQIDAYKTRFELGMPFNIAIDYNNVLANLYYTEFVPTTVIIDKYGRIDYYSVGAETNADNWKSLFAYYADEEYLPGDPTWKK